MGSLSVNSYFSRGRYLLAQEINVGGSAKTFRAIDRQRGNRPVILKVVERSDKFSVNCLNREAVVLEQDLHFRIPNIYDFGITGKYKYLSLEYFHGTNLRELLQQEKLDLVRATSIVMQLAFALAAMHNRGRLLGRNGLIHRDMKPENVLVAGPVARLIDFGIACPVGFEDVTEARSGTPEYIAPEQIIGNSLDQRTDQYGLGLVFYEMIRGENPMGGVDQVTSLLNHLRQPLPLIETRDFNLRVPFDQEVGLRATIAAATNQFNNTLQRMTAKKPVNRFANMEELLPQLVKCHSLALQMIQATVVMSAVATDQQVVL